MNRNGKNREYGRSVLNKNGCGILTGIVFLSALLAGCGQQKEILPNDYVQTEEGTTLDLAEGMTAEEFQEKMGDHILTLVTGDGYTYCEADEIDYDSNPEILVTDYFVDGQMQTVRQMCENYGVTAEEISTLLISGDFLKEHAVEVGWMDITFRDGKIETMQGELTDINKEVR